MPKAYVSSTFVDLEEYRRFAQRILRQFGYEVIAMEDYAAENARPLDRCLADVSACDLYVGIYAWRYGFVPKGQKLSITELEYQRAVQYDKPRLLFVVEAKAAWPMDLCDLDRSRVSAFHERLREDMIVATFATPDRLAAELAVALQRHRTTALEAQDIDIVAYARFLRRQYISLDLDALTEAKRDELTLLRLQSIFVEQNVKEDSPPIELPKELIERLVARTEANADDLPKGMTTEMLAELKNAYASKPPRPVLEVLAADGNRCAIVLGDPGSGKSTLLRYITLSLIDGRALEPALTGNVPFLVDLKSYTALRAQDKCDTFFSYFDVLTKEDDCPVSGRELKEHLGAGEPSVVMFDGIDEIFNPEEQEKITKQIIAFTESYPQARVIVTSRVIGYRRTLLTQAGFVHFTLQDLDEKQVNEFVRQWYTITLGGKTGEAEARVERIRQSFQASSSIRQLAGNPMLLTIMAIIGKHQDLPRERWKLYDHAAGVLVQHWDVKKHLADKKLGNDLMDEEDKKELLRRLAYAMQRGDGGLAGNYIHAEDLQFLFEEYLRERYAFDPARAKITAREMIAQFRARNFILSFYGANVYGFVHRAFLEFFCADAIRLRFEKTKELPLSGLIAVFDEHWREKEWQEVLRLICGMIGEEFVAALIEHLRSLGWKETEGKNITLAVECLEEVRRPELVRKASGKLIVTLLEWGISTSILDQTQHLDRALDVAQRIGPRWLADGEILRWLDARHEGNFLFSGYRLGEVIGTILAGSAEAREAILRHMQSDHPLSDAVILALATGWPGPDTVATLINASDNDDIDDMGSVIYAAATHLSQYPKAVDWVFDQYTLHMNSIAKDAIITFLAGQARAIAILLEFTQSENEWYRRRAVEGLENHVALPRVQRALQQVASSDPQNIICQQAAAILTRVGIAVKPKLRK
jgi:energy-coupling factor transporter ATP-binding protein EcfA2